MASEHQFSVYVIRIGPAGQTALTSANIVGVNQEVTLEIQYGRHDLFDAAANSIFAIDSADHEGKASLKFSNKDIAPAIWQYTAGMTSASGTVGGNSAAIYTLGQTSKPVACRIEMDGVTTSGKNMHLIATYAKFRGHSIAAKITDFADFSLEADLYPDAGATPTGTVFTYSVDN